MCTAYVLKNYSHFFFTKFREIITDTYFEVVCSISDGRLEVGCGWCKDIS